MKKNNIIYIVLIAGITIIVILGGMIAIKKNNIAKSEYEDAKNMLEQKKTESDSLQNLRDKLENELSDLKSRSVY